MSKMLGVLCVPVEMSINLEISDESNNFSLFAQIKPAGLRMAPDQYGNVSSVNVGL
jgi:hypothetical protein